MYTSQLLIFVKLLNHMWQVVWDFSKVLPELFAYGIIRRNRLPLIKFQQSPRSSMRNHGKTIQISNGKWEEEEWTGKYWSWARVFLNFHAVKQLQFRYDSIFRAVSVILNGCITFRPIASGFCKMARSKYFLMFVTEALFGHFSTRLDIVSLYQDYRGLSRSKFCWGSKAPFQIHNEQEPMANPRTVLSGWVLSTALSNPGNMLVHITYEKSASSSES